MVGVRTVATEFTSEGETLRGNFVLPEGDGPFPGICKFHGIPGGPDQVSGLATELAKAGFAVLTFDFRGFRKSDGMFSLAREITDAPVAVTHLLKSEFTVDSWVGIYAASYGAAVAICSAAVDPRVSAICIRAPVYDTLWFAQTPMVPAGMKQIAATDPSQVHGIEDPEIQKRALVGMIEDGKKHNPMKEIAKLSPRPLLIIHGADDVGIDLAGVKRLYELAGEPKDLVVVQGADHELSNPVAYEVTMRTAVEWFTKQWNEL